MYETAGRGLAVLFQRVQRLLQFPATLFLFGTETRFRQRAFLQRVPPIIVERTILIELELLVLRVAGRCEVRPARASPEF